jgi:hypothetical protein
MDATLPLDVVSRVFSFLSEMSLTAAVGTGDLELVKLLVAVGMGPCTAQHMDEAARRGHLEIVKFLHHRSPAGCTVAAMDCAISNGHLEIVRFLHFQRRAPVSPFPACRAVNSGHPTVARFLIKHRSTEIQPSLLHNAASSNYPEVIVDYLQLNPSVSTAYAKYVAVLWHTPDRDTIELLKLLYDKGEDKAPSEALRYAAKLGHLDLVKYLVKQGEGFVWKAIEAAVENRHLEILQHLLDFACAELEPSAIVALVDTAVANDDLAMVSYLCGKFPDTVCSREVFVSVAERGHTAMVKVLNHSGHTGTRGQALSRAAHNHHFEVVKLLAPDSNDSELQEAAVAALHFGHFDVAKFLVEFRLGRRPDRGTNDRENCLLCQTFVVLDRVFQYGSSGRSAKALAVAARAGDLDAVTYLAERNIGDLQHATMQAIGHGHHHIVKYLIEATRVVSNQSLSRLNWLAEAARAGHLDIFIYLHEKLPGLVCRPMAMDHAASMGYFDVVKYIHTHRTEGCTTKAMDGAAMGNHIEIVRFLHANRTEGCSSRAFEKSAERGRTEMVKLLLKISPGKCNVDKCIQLARKRGFVETVGVLENFKALDTRTPLKE